MPISPPATGRARRAVTASRGPPGRLIPWIQGSFTAVVGLPLAETAGLLQAAGYPVYGGAHEGADDRSGSLRGGEAAALMVDGRLEDLLIDSDAPRPGTIYRAIADRPVKGQGGMFLRTPDGPAFLRQVKGLAPGQPILVQVTGHAEPGKALPVTAKILFKSRYAIVTPGAPGSISRAAFATTTAAMRCSRSPMQRWADATWA